MIKIDKVLFDCLFEKATFSERKRMNYDLRTSEDDSSQRMLNALLPGTVVPIHRHPMSTENLICLCGKLVSVLYDADGNETERFTLDPSVGNSGCVVPVGVWHTVEVMEPSVIYESKDGAYGYDGSEIYDSMKKPKAQIPCLIGIERQSGSLGTPSPQYISRMLNISLEDVVPAVKEMGIYKLTT